MPTLYDAPFLIGRLAQAGLFLPVAMLILLVLLAAAMWALGIGVRGPHGVRAVFDHIEADPRALATFLAGVIVAAALIVAALVR
jgi:hypothetical protein